MPIYEYECRACGHQMEALQKMSDPALTDCPQCKQAELNKKISAAGFRLSGGGWYETDFKNSGNKKNLVGSADTSATKVKSADGGAASPASSKPAAVAK